MKKKLLAFFLFISIISLVTSCEKLTASLDGVDKEKTAESEAAPEPVAEQEQSESEDSTDVNVLTGSTVVEVEEESEEPGSTTHTVKMTADGFSPDKLYIKVGDTVLWKNTRFGTINKAMIIGVRECSKVRSGFLKPGESFSWTFDTPMACTLADGIMTTKESKIFVEE